MKRIDRLMAKVSVDDATGCWVWTGVAGRGYGVFWLPPKMTYSHRAAYELLVGPIPAGMESDHLCRRLLCCNPAHLEPVTHMENVQRARPTACKNGHPFVEATTYIDPRGWRHCRPCDSERQRNRKAA